MSGAYYIYKPEVRKNIERYEEDVKEVAGEKLITYVFPIVAAAAGQDGTIKVTKYVSIRGKNKWEKLDLLYSYSF